MKKSLALFIAIWMAASLAVSAAADSALSGFTINYEEPQCFLETEEITMSASSITVDEDDYLVIDTLVENHSDGKVYEVCIPRAAVNGVEIYPTYCEDVEDECTEPIEIGLYNVLENTDIADITDIELTVSIEDDDFETVYYGTVHIYPHGRDKAVKYQRLAADTDIVIVDNDQFAVTVIGCEYVEDWGYSVHMYIQNKMQTPIFVEGEYFHLNDVVADTWYDDIIGGNDVCFSHLEWSQGDLDDAEISEVTSVKFLLRIYNSETDKMLLDQDVELVP